MKKKHFDAIMMFCTRCEPDEYLNMLLDWGEGAMRDDRYSVLNSIDRSRISGIWRLMYTAITIIYRISDEFNKTSDTTKHYYLKRELIFFKHYIDIAHHRVHKKTVVELYSYYNSSPAGEGYPEEERSRILNNFLALGDICKPLYKVGQAILSQHENNSMAKDEVSED